MLVRPVADLKIACVYTAHPSWPRSRNVIPLHLITPLESQSPVCSWRVDIIVRVCIHRGRPDRLIGFEGVFGFQEVHGAGRHPVQRAF
jgi:hypothetical protein